MEQKFYICKHCGNIIAKVKDTGVPVICCGEPMSEIVPGTTDAAVEKHVPVWTVENGIVHVKVGSVEHVIPCCRSTTSSGCLSTPSRAISVRNCTPAKSRRSASLSARAMRSKRSTPTATSTVCGKRDSSFKRGCRTNVRQLILYIQHKTPSFEKPGVRGIISLCN